MDEREVDKKKILKKKQRYLESKLYRILRDNPPWSHPPWFSMIFLSLLSFWFFRGLFWALGRRGHPPAPSRKDKKDNTIIKNYLKSLQKLGEINFVFSFVFSEKSIVIELN